MQHFSTDAGMALMVIFDVISQRLLLPAVLDDPAGGVTEGRARVTGHGKPVC